MLPRRPFLVTMALLSALLLHLGCDEPAKVVEPPPASSVNDAQSEDALIQLLARAYREQDCELFADLFPVPSDSIEYAYFFNQPVNGVYSWGRDAELRTHWNMFRCDSIPPPAGLWLVSITIQLTRIASSWVERTDLYRTATNPTGLDAARWRVTEAEFHADILFETQGDTDYRVDGRENFIVVQDLVKPAGAARRYLIYRWEDLDPPIFPYTSDPALATAPTRWSGIKHLYLYAR